MGGEFLRLADFVAIAHVALGAEAETIESGLGVVPERLALDARATPEVEPSLGGQRERIEGVVLGVAVVLVGAGNAIGVQASGGEAEVAGLAATAYRCSAAKGPVGACLGE